MKRFFLIVISALICGVWFSNCNTDNMQGEIIDNLQSKITDDPQDDGDEIMEEPETPQDGDEITEEPEELQGEITYPKYGKYGFVNILADDFVEATPTVEKLVEYSLSAEVPAGAGLKVVIRSIHEDPRVEWGGFYPDGNENWYATNWDQDLRGNTFTVYENGKPAHVIITFIADCIIEYYENGATTPTKVKEIKMNPLGDGTDNRKPEDDITYSGEITYPKYGKYGFLNILADDFVEATPNNNTLVEYSLNADVPVGAGLKIVIRSLHEDPRVEWGGFYPSSIENWYATYWDQKLRGNTFTVYESGKPAQGMVTFIADCIIEYYENGATTPTKVKEIKMNPLGDGTDNRKLEEDITYSGEIIYPKYGKYGFLNILADDFVEATPNNNKLVEYSLNVEVPVGAGLKIIIRSIHENPIVEWGGFYQSSIENWYATYWDPDLRGNTFTVYESGKPAHATITFIADCVIEYYENGAKTPTKVKTIRMKK